MMTMVDGMMTAGSAVRLSHTVEKGTSLPFQSEMPMFLSSTKTMHYAPLLSSQIPSSDQEQDPTIWQRLSYFVDGPI